MKERWWGLLCNKRLRGDGFGLPLLYKTKREVECSEYWDGSEPVKVTITYEVSK